jgi:hypothetical protein
VWSWPTPQLTIVYGGPGGFLHHSIEVLLIDLAVGADTGTVTRGLGLVAVLISLVLVGVLMAKQSKSAGPTSATVNHAESQAVSTAALAVFQPVDQVLQVDASQTGTYVGAQLPPGTGVTLARATTSSYCLDATLSGTPVHENGPGGTPALGHC